MRLINLLKDIKYTSNFDVDDIKISDLSCNTREDKSQGYLFMCIKGIDSDGHQYILKALEDGADIIVGSENYEKIKENNNIDEDFKYIQIDKEEDRKIWSILCRNYFKYEPQKQKIIAVTGTDGKTTTTNFIYQILLKSGKNVGLISTIGIFFNNENIAKTSSHNTTPDAYLIYKFLKDFEERNTDFVVLEVSSYAQTQYRIYGLEFEVAGITNITHEHLEQHKIYENYAKAKSDILDQAKIKFINYGEIHHNLDIFKKLNNQKEWNLNILEKYNIDIYSFSEKFIGEYNKKNLALAITLIENLNDPELLNDLQLKIDTLETIVGRFNHIENSLEINIIVDYAHTPYGLESLLKGIRENISENSKIHCVFGCEGKRDAGKRSKMGFIAKEYADISYLTPIDPRDEAVSDINNEIEQGWKSNSNNPEFLLYKFTDRREGINRAILNAKADDYVLLLGKGDETTMNMGKGSEPYSDFDVVKDILDKIGNS